MKKIIALLLAALMALALVGCGDAHGSLFCESEHRVVLGVPRPGKIEYGDNKGKYRYVISGVTIDSYGILDITFEESIKEEEYFDIK